MTRKEIALMWAEGKLTENEVREEMAKTEHPVLRNYDPLNESDSWWEGEEENTSMSVGIALINRYGKEKAEEFMEKFWVKAPIVKYDPNGNRVE